MGKVQISGAIATSHYLASRAGARVIQQGGNAVDAAITAAAVLCVVYPNNVTLGGDLVALVRSPDGRVRFLNATGTAARLASREALISKYGARLPTRGIDTVTLPGGVRGWEALHRAGATQHWSDHFVEAIEYAEQGFPNSRSVARSTRDELHELAQNEGWSSLFCPEGSPLAEGVQLKQPALAESIRKIAKLGANEFYEGKLAESWVSSLGKFGSKITLEDAKHLAAFWTKPLSTKFGQFDIHTGPPNSSGFILLRALNSIEGTGPEFAGVGITDPLGRGAGRLAGVIERSNSIRAQFLADPEFGPDGETLLRMMPDSPSCSSTDVSANGDTVGLSAATSDGWAVSLINSIYFAFGSGVLDPLTGILFQNRGTAFSLDPSSPNAFAPGKRPRHTLMPVMVESDGSVLWVPATMGGSAQPQIHIQLMMRYLAGTSPTVATSAPRWIVQEPDEIGRVSVIAEAGVDISVVNSLAEAGYTVKLLPDHSEDFGHSNLVGIFGNGFVASSDPRSDGSAIVIENQGASHEFFANGK